MARYTLAPAAPTPVEDFFQTLDPLVYQLLYNRGLHDSVEARRFLEPSYDEHLHDPALLEHIDVAVDRIAAAMEKQEHIAIFSDYDCDGIPGAVVLSDFFRHIGYEAVSVYIPHRHYEGFGLSTTAIEKLHERGATLVITIDCGTTDHEAVARANELGMDVIVTDHHEPGPQLPEAIAVINPKLGTYPFTDLCGTAVVFKLVQALIATGAYNLTPGWEKWWLDMVGVATIADMVPLVGENRVLATYGLQVLRKSRRPGLQQLLQKVRANQRYLTEDDIGFTIGPRINAASRMDTPEDAFALLTETDEATARSLVEHLEHLNNERKGQVAAMSKELHKRVEALEELPPVLVFGSPNWRPALAGLAANKLAETYKRPAFIWGRDGNDVIKGSCRSDGTTSVHALMHAVPDVFLEFGGHHFSGGFSVKEDAIHTFAEELIAAHAAVAAEAVIDEEIQIDAELTLGDVFDRGLRAIHTLQPFGMNNPKPLFRFAEVTPMSVEVFGKTKEHTKLLFETDRGRLEAIQFFKLPTDYQVELTVGEPVTMLGHIEQSYFMGRQQLRVRIVDILPA